MPRTPLVSEVIKAPTNSVVASAARYPANTRRIYRKSEDWQDQAWYFYDSTGELRYAANWIANVCSRAILNAARWVPADNSVSIDSASTQAVAAMAALFDGQDGQSQMLSAIGLHLTVAGECYLVGRSPSPERSETPGRDIWEIVGTQEMKHYGAKWAIDYGDGNKPLELKDEDVVIRIWRPHPRRRIDADSPVRALLSTLRELELLSRHVQAQATSRLAGAGVLVLPQGMTFPSPPEDSGLPANASSADVFMNVLGDAMMTPITDPGAASAVVPIVVTAPDELVDRITHLTFWSDLDEHAVELRNEAIRRFALGMDIPPEIVLGTADVNHWGAWQIDESSIKATIEPLLELVTNALTVGYLQPITNDSLDVVAFDTSRVRLRPNRSREAIELYDRGELDPEALRRETGFSEDDAPSPDEFKAWMLKKVASGSTTPEQVADALVALGVMGIRDMAAAPPTQGRPAPSLRDHPDTGPPTREPTSAPQPQPATLEAVCEVLVFRALERAGNRLRSIKQVRPACPAVDTYLFVAAKPGDLDKLMEDAWSCVPRVLSNLPEFQRVLVTHALDAYVRDLLVSQQQHTTAEMMRHVTSTAMRRLERS